MFDFGFGFDILSVMFTVTFVLVLAVFVVALVRGIGQWSKNNHSPRLTVAAVVVGKRTNAVRHHSGTGVGHTNTTYYATFQVESGDRMELMMNGWEYGMLCEGDRGRLTFQGTRYLGFERT